MSGRPQDWATEEAQVIADTLRRSASLPTAIDWLAAKLRVIKHEGRAEGLDAAADALNEVFRPGKEKRA